MAVRIHPWLKPVYDGRFQIADRWGGLTTLVPTYIQNICFMDWNRKLNRKEHIRELILKPRQVKVSSAVAALIVGASLHEKNLTSVIGNLSADQQGKLWEQKYKTYCDRYLNLATGEPEKPATDYYSLDRIKFTDSGSNIYNEIHGLDMARGATVQIAHLTEFPFWDQAEPEACLTQLMRTIPDGYPTCVFIESTAAKDGDWFETTFRKGWKAQQNGSAIPPKWGARFFRWFENEEYQVERVTREMREMMLDSLDDEEKWLVEEMAEDFDEREMLAKLIWRRTQLEDTDAAEFRKDYPATIDDAFRSKRISMFDHQSLDWYSRQRRNPEFVGNVGLDLVTKTAQIDQDSLGLLHIWQIPRAGHEYVISADVGNEGSRDKYRSTTGLVVKDANTCKTVATWQGMINPWDFTEVVYALGRHYNWGLVAVEKAAGGGTVLNRLENELAYPNIYASGTYTTGSDALGFSTNVKTRPQILDYLRWCVRRKVIDIPCTRLQREMENFKEGDNGKMKAPKGFTDDLVMAEAIACWIASRDNPNWRPRDKTLLDEIVTPKAARRVVVAQEFDPFGDVEDLMAGRGRSRSPFEKLLMGE